MSKTDDNELIAGKSQKNDNFDECLFIRGDVIE